MVVLYSLTTVKNDHSFYSDCMPRVSEAHLAARRQQILEAAWRCFTREGFHATSMQDVFAEAGLSAGAVYRYFPSKAELVRTTAEGIAGTADEAFEQMLAADPVPRPDEALRTAIAFITKVAEEGEIDRTRVALHVFSEALRDPEINEVVTAVAQQLIGRWTQLAKRWLVLGYLPADANPETVGRTLYGVMIGFLVQRHLVGTGAAAYADGFSWLVDTPDAASVAKVAGSHA